MFLEKYFIILCFCIRYVFAYTSAKSPEKRLEVGIPVLLKKILFPLPDGINNTECIWIYQREKENPNRGDCITCENIPYFGNCSVNKQNHSVRAA